MTNYGEYSGYNCVIGFYRHGELACVIENVNPETVFLNEAYSGSDHHILEFDYTENDKPLKGIIDIYLENSFCIFPEWMGEKLKRVLEAQEQEVNS